MEQHDLIDYILSDRTNSFKTPPDGVSKERYEEAIDIAAELGLIKDVTRNNYFVLPLGREILAAGGYRTWRMATSAPDDLARVYSTLKAGNYKGIELNEPISGRPVSWRDNEYARQLANQAINDGFAEYVTDPSSNGFFGSGVFIRLSSTGRNYATYDAYSKRHQSSSTIYNNSVNNSITGSNNSGNNQGRDFLSSQLPIAAMNQPVKAIPNEKPITKSDHTIWDKIKYWSVILGALGSVISLLALIGKAKGWW